jgi:hypothetical protein
MKSWLSLIRSSVIPMPRRSSPHVSRQFGSIASSAAKPESPLAALALPVDIRWSCCGTEFRGDSGGVGWKLGAELFLCPPNSPPRIPCFCIAFEGALPPNWFNFVALLAFFSRSFIFFRKVFASFSSTKDRPAKQSSVSKVWKNVRSWL